MSDKWHKILAWAAMAFVAGATMAIAPGGPLADRPQVVQWLHWLTGVFGVLGIGMLKPVAGGGSSSGGGGVVKLTFVALALGLFAGGCAGWPVFRNCLKANIPSDQQMLTAIIAVAAQPTNYVADLEQLAALASDAKVVPCIAAALLADADANPRLKGLASHLREYLTKYPITVAGCGPVPSGA
jgi:hypothetical protein